ncbi:MAG TPA: phenylalanine--tRNA ligase beta subunit-related protein [Thermoanaerobaculia bacterium]|nr:phenylalanine--tRNA ligase beta subunit-related protein [Thermoanaerobaculia bacterium]
MTELLPLDRPPFPVEHELEGWELLWARLETTTAPPEATAELRSEAGRIARERFAADGLASHPVIAELRRLFRAAGTDPTRYRPSSEALLRRLLKGEALPAISPLVDLNNCLSARLGVPCCVMEERALEPPFVLRAGAPGEEYESLKGPFRLEGRPLLVDARGPCDAPITGSQRVKVTDATVRAWLVGYLPASAMRAEAAAAELQDLLDAAPAALCELVAASR